MLPLQSARGGCFTKGKYKGKYQKCLKVHFDNLNIIWGDFKPHNRFPGQILILLDTQDLSVGQKLPKLDIAKNGNWQWQKVNVAMSNLGNFWPTDKSWVSKSIRILPGNRLWGLKSPQLMFRLSKCTFIHFLYFPLYFPFVKQHPLALCLEGLQAWYLCL